MNEIHLPPRHRLRLVAAALFLTAIAAVTVVSCGRGSAASADPACSAGPNSSSATATYRVKMQGDKSANIDVTGTGWCGSGPVEVLLVGEIGGGTVGHILEEGDYVKLGMVKGPNFDTTFKVNGDMPTESRRIISFEALTNGDMLMQQDGGGSTAQRLRE